ncbi:MAG: urease accessory protein UreE [Gammaproteobacteria bacterium]
MTTLLKIFERIDSPASEGVSLTLPFEKRQKHRFQANLDNGQQVGLMLPREGVLRDGDYLQAEDGQVIKVCAANEEVSVVEHDDPFQLMRACYHLGNRHVPLQIGEGWIRYQRDHVLDDMVKHLGLTVKHEVAPFEPEAGAYHHHH